MTTELVSIVIPAYNESARIGRTIATIAEYCDASDLPAEIVVVDDGSRDETAEAATAAEHGRADLRVIRQPGNRGKGSAIKAGVLAARGTYVLFTDADLSVPITELEKLLAPMRAGAPIAIGSRRLRGSPLWRFVPGRRDLATTSIKVHQPFHREALGEVYHRLVSRLLGVPVKDLNCGFKCFRADVARAVFGQMLIERWGFDAEILLIAHRQGVPIQEVEVAWYDNPMSKVNLATAPFSSLIEVGRIKLNDLNGRYRTR